MKKNKLRKFIQIPNLFTLVRLLAIPVLWVLAFKGYWVAVGVGFLLASLTDSLDGYFARRLDLVSDFGSQFDSIADHLIGPSAIIWLVMLDPGVFTNNWLIFSIAVLLYLTRLVFGALKFKRFANMHLYTSKIYSGIQFVFLVVTFLMEGYWPPFFYFLVGFFILSVLEALILMATHDEIDEHMGSVIHVYRKKKAEAAGIEGTSNPS
ncbi:CDP-alcohol phosphatidyltransferase family protein [Chloroflexota bacterium]